MKAIMNNETMTSREMAHLAEKSHAHLMRDIRKMEESWLKIGQSKFGQSYYINSQNRKMPMYTLTQTESLYIATKFNDKARGKLVLRWKELQIKENQQAAQSPMKQLSRKEILQMALEAEELAEKKQKEIDRLKPKAELVNRIVECKELLDIGQAAKLLQLPYGRNTLYKNLRSTGIFFKNKNEPMQAHVNAGYFKLKEIMYKDGYGEDRVGIKVYVTQKGLEFLSKRLGFSKVINQLATIN